MSSVLLNHTLFNLIYINNTNGLIAFHQEKLDKYYWNTTWLLELLFTLPWQQCTLINQCSSAQRLDVWRWVWSRSFKGNTGDRNLETSFTFKETNEYALIIQITPNFDQIVTRSHLWFRIKRLTAILL